MCLNLRAGGHFREKSAYNCVFLVKYYIFANNTIIIYLYPQVSFDEKFFHHSFVYPDFSAEDGALQEFIAADLIEVSMKKALERLGVCLQ